MRWSLLAARATLPTRIAMSIFSEIEKLKAKHVLFGLVGFLGTIGPGFLLIYRYHPELVEKYDVGKLV